jgi:hypothetical protein
MLEPLYDYQIMFQRESFGFMERVIRKNIRKPQEITSFFSEEYDYNNYQMNEKELLEYNMAQLSEIEKYKKYLEQKHGCAYTLEEVIDIWAQKYSQRFRKYWHLKQYIKIL